MTRRRRKRRAKLVSSVHDSGIGTTTSYDEAGSSDSDLEYISRDKIFKKEIPVLKDIDHGTTRHHYLRNIQNTEEFSNQNTKKEDEESISNQTKKKLLWKQSIPIEMSNNVDELTKQAIKDATEELEIKTCLRFHERTYEGDYLQFDKRDGCWSHVGRMGGRQVISIGAGCEQTGTILHEIMHAIGFHHEHSRPDRDDYVEITWPEIPEEMKKNFVKESDVSDADRKLNEPYDYESVMHYSGDDFSKSGKFTIRTLNPQYQNTIGQRDALSRGDARKINKLYKCDKPARNSVTVDFESKNFEEFSQSHHEKKTQWRLHKNGDQKKEPYVLMPHVDSTFEKESQGSYLYIKNEGKPGIFGKLQSIIYVSKATEQCLVFSTYQTKTAALHVHSADVDPTTGETTSFGSSVYKFKSGCDNTWCVQRKTIHAPRDYRLVFRGKFEDDSAGIIALDDISVTDRKCEDSYFTVQDYIQKIESSKPNEYEESETMYTAESGYAFKLRVFPNGTQADVDNDYHFHTGIQIVIVGGKYDHQLPWPLPQHVVKLCVIDQAVNPSTQMSHCEYFYIGGDSHNTSTAYQKPACIRALNTPITCVGLMENSKFTTKRFLKHGAASFSATVTGIIGSRPTPTTETVKPDESVEITENGIVHSDSAKQRYIKRPARLEHKSDHESTSNKKNAEHGKLKRRHMSGNFVAEDEENLSEKAWAYARTGRNDTSFYGTSNNQYNTSSSGGNTTSSTNRPYRKGTKKRANNSTNVSRGAKSSHNRDSTTIHRTHGQMSENYDYYSTNGGYFPPVFRWFFNILCDICSFIYNNSPSIFAENPPVVLSTTKASGTCSTSNPSQGGSNPKANNSKPSSTASNSTTNTSASTACEDSNSFNKAVCSASNKRRDSSFPDKCVDAYSMLPPSSSNTSPSSLDEIQCHTEELTSNLTSIDTFPYSRMSRIERSFLCNYSYKPRGSRWSSTESTIQATHWPTASLPVVAYGYSPMQTANCSTLGGGYQCAPSLPVCAPSFNTTAAAGGCGPLFC